MNIAGLRAFIKCIEQSAALSCTRLLAISVLASGLASGLPASAEESRLSDPTMSAEKAMVATANPHASTAALEMLKAGGSALDAAVAAQMVLGLVEPQSSGIGGGGFLLHYDGPAEALTSYDGRETAPAAASPSMFLQADGTPRGWLDVARGGQPVGVPGVVAMLEAAHRAHGVLPWATLFEPAIRLAESGFDVSPRLSEMITRNAGLADYEAARAYFFRSDGTPLQPGDRLTNPAYGQTLRAIAADGAAALMTGDIARDIVQAVRRSAVNPGLLSEQDLARYRPHERTPVCNGYRQWIVCGMGPPTSGGLTVLQILGILSHFDLAALEPGSLEAVHLISEASRLAYADRARFMADSDFVDVPVVGLLDPAYLESRAGLIDLTRSMGKAPHGAPPGSDARAYAADASPELPSTSHLVVVDAAGNAVSFTTSVERAFGSRLMVHGFLLNNQLTDFSFVAEQDGRTVANRIEPGKRPRSSMSPMLVFDRYDNLVLAVGSPGGSRIITFVTQVLIAMLDWNLDPQPAVALPHHVNRGGATELEIDTAIAVLAPALEAMGHEIKIQALTSGLHAIRVTPNGLTGGADPRREGTINGY